MKKTLFLSTAIAASLFAPQARGIVYRDDMTDAESIALSQQQQFSGAGIISAGGTGVAIAPGWVLTAKHVVGSATSTTFYYGAGNGYAAGNRTGTVFTDPNSDLALVHFATDLPTGMAFITPNQTRSVTNRTMWSVGYGTYGHWTTDAPNYFAGNGNPRAGTNVTDLNSTGLLGFDNDNTSASATLYESSTGPGDSGGPMYLQDGNQWFVAGIVFGVGGGAFIDTDVSAVSNQAWITTTTGLVFTPKAASLALTWDSAVSTRGIQDGAGTWDTTRTNFHDGTYNYAWDNSLSQQVTFGSGGTAGVVTIDAAVSANKIVFARTGYTLAGTGTDTLTLNGTTPTLDLGAAAIASTINAPLRGTSITVSNAGTLTLGGTDDNTSTGFILNGGIIKLNKTSSGSVHAIGSNGVTINTGATLQLTGTGNDQIADTGNLTLAGGVFDLNGRAETVNSLTGSSGSVDNTSATVASLGITGGTFSGVIKNTGAALSLTKLGTGTAILSGTNSYQGATAVQAGTLRLTTAAALGASSGVSLSNATTTGGAGTTLDLQGGLTFSGVPLKMTSDNVAGDYRTSLLSSSGANTWAAPITLNGSGLNIFNATTSLAVSGAISPGAGTFTGTLLLRGAADGTLGSTINLGGGSLAKTDGGTWTIASSGNTWQNTTVSVGTLKLGATNALPTTTVVTLGQNDTSAVTLDLNGFDQTVAGLLLNSTGGTKAITNTGTARTLTVANAAADSFGGVLSGALGLTKSAAGTLTLTGANTYTGNTLASAGSLVVGGALSGTISVKAQNATVELNAANLINNAATLTLENGVFDTNGFSETLGALTILGSSATIDFGLGASILHLANSSANSALWAGTLSITNWTGSLTGGGTDELFFGVNASGLDAAQLARIQFISPPNLPTGNYGAKLLSSGELVPIPEPGAIGLLAAGALLGWRRRR